MSLPSDDTSSNRPSPTIKVMLAGNPNAGKTSVFNALTGSRQHVANYAGVTVEQRAGVYREAERRVDLVDLPGTYSLSSYSPEELIAQQQLLEGNPDVVVVVVDSTNLKRGLVFLAQVMQLGVRTILCMNMADEAEAAGQRVDLPQMRKLLGIDVVQTVGHRAQAFCLKGGMLVETLILVLIIALAAGAMLSRTYSAVKAFTQPQVNTSHCGACSCSKNPACAALSPLEAGQQSEGERS